MCQLDYLSENVVDLVLLFLFEGSGSQLPLYRTEHQGLLNPRVNFAGAIRQEPTIAVLFNEKKI
jgi:hypothetical protein